MSVLHVVVAGEIGGAERMLVDLAQGASSRPHAVALFTPNAALRRLFVDAGLDVEDRGAVREGPLTYLARSLGPGDARWLTGVIEARRARIVHLHTFGSQVLGTRAALRARARVVRTEHSTRVFDDPSCWPFSRWSLRKADASVCISEHVAAVARARAPWAAPILTVIPNGVDVARFTPRAELAPPRTRVRFVALGRLEPRKGLDRALAAVARVPEAELEIAGDGPDRAELERLSLALGLGERVRFTGYHEDVRPVIARADLALSSARSEGLGVALLEAMAMERPVVALPTGGVPEIVEDGETGWLAHGSSVEALARAMREAVERRDEIRRRGARARARVARGFSIEAMRAAYERLYAALAP